MNNFAQLSSRPSRTRSWLPLAAAVSAALWQTPARTQQDDSAEGRNQDEGQRPIEEVVAVGRFQSASEQLIDERIDDASVIDALGADSISRLGDSTVADALRRVPGLSLVDDKFVYIRGLGERYSRSYLNGAVVPSPDLTRNVVPLDVFPTSVVQSLQVQKAWAPDVPANFGGGSINIRTLDIPRGFESSFEFSSGFNTENSGTALSYPGGGDDSLGTDDGTRALSPAILSATNRFQGELSVPQIEEILQSENPDATRADAEQFNRELATELNRNIGLREDDISPDVGLRASIGNRFQFSDDWDFGAQAGISYDTEWRERTATLRNPNPNVVGDIDTRRESTESVNISGILNLGLSFTEDHQIGTTSLFLRNTDDEAEVLDFFNENRRIPSGSGFRQYRFEFEERNMRTSQIRGSHYLGEATRDRFPTITGWLDWLPRETRVQWFHSDSTAETDIPNRVTVQSQTDVNPETGEVLNSYVRAINEAAEWRFTDLDDQVDNSGWSINIPVETRNSIIELRGGAEHSDKARTYMQSLWSLGPTDAPLSVRQGPLDQVFSDENVLNPENGFVFGRRGTNNQSYIAATMTDSVFGSVDWTLNDTWRLAAGGRWEDYRQVALDWNPFGNSQTNPQVTTDEDELESRTFTQDEVYPAASFTYMSRFWAETFQLRFGWSETQVRPDLREITDASYVDPVTGILTAGNTGVVPADVTNFDIRAEWFFANGDLFSATLFRKEFLNPIEFFETPASDTTVARQIFNAESAESQGVEIEFLKELGFFGPNVLDTMFIQGNMTFQDTELVAGPTAPSGTNPTRPLAGASDYMLNFMLGYDSSNNRHTASLVFNVFGERLYTGALNGPDAYEQPFRSLDVTYSWYPTNALTFKAKLQNILDESIEIQRGEVVTFEEAPGSNYALSVQWDF